MSRQPKNYLVLSKAKPAKAKGNFLAAKTAFFSESHILVHVLVGGSKILFSAGLPGLIEVI